MAERVKVGDRIKLRKDPQARLDWQADWSDWVPDGDSLDQFTLSITGPDAVLTSPVSSLDGNTVTFWLAGGTLGETYDVVMHVVTVDGREEDQTFKVQIRDN